ncbi:MAG: hypothetical protein J5582_13595 [Ruminococcus sp.]|uniref:hypothetical protein n=1 Tax=Ruminococcus sp. TaxID=41978 RepID=UPI0025ECE167|nr:hypothetical protein [Ruminococcus sp.]MBO4867570.1 hypothetical protein [Ruminococcus sp.]
MKSKMELPFIGESEKEMYGEIDRFLGMSARYSSAGIWRAKIAGLAGGLIFAAVFYVGMQYTDDKTRLMVLMIISLLFGLSMLCFYGSKPFPAMINFQKVIEEDGAERIYSDMKTARRINGSSIYLGSEYVFDTDGQLFRMCDVKNVYIKEMDNKGLKVYYAAMDISGGSGDGFVIIKRLTGRNEEKRIQQFMEVKEMFAFDGRCARN